VSRWPATTREEPNMAEWVIVTAYWVGIVATGAVTAWVDMRT
jgi:hypothetical protein